MLPWNAVRADSTKKSRRGFVESYFLKLNDGRGERALWLKATLFAKPKEDAIAEGWVIAFHREKGHRAVKHTVPANRASFSSTGLSVDAAGVHLEEGRTSGSITRAGTTISWDLRFEGDAPPIAPLPLRAMYNGPFPSTKLVSPHPDLRFTGHYDVDGVRTEVDGFRGMQGHNWGSGHTHLYAWTHIAGFDNEPDLVLEAMTGQVKVGGFLLPPQTLVSLRHRGARYEWTRVRDLPNAKGIIDVSGLRWTFEATSDLGTIKGELTGDAGDFVGLTYDNPKGTATSCLNSKIARARVQFSPYGRAAIVANTREAAFEIGTKEPHPVRMYV